MSADLKKACSSLEEFYNKKIGVRSMSSLRNGAQMTFILDGEPLNVQKVDGQMKVEPGKPDKSDLTVELSSKTLDEMVHFKDENKMRDKLGYTTGHPTDDLYFKVEVTMGDDEKSFQEFFWMGYSFWLRRMGFTE